MENMEMVTMETDYNELKEKAKGFGLNPTGKSRAVLVEFINKKIEEATKIEDQTLVTEGTQTGEVTEGQAAPTAKAPRAPKAKWFEGKELPVTQGQTVLILGGLLKDRFAKVTHPSNKKVNATKAHLINPYTGELQGTHITLDFDNIKVVDPSEVVITPKGTKAAKAATPAESTESPVASTEEVTA